MCIELLKAINYLHKNNVCHRKIYLENIAVIDGHLKLHGLECSKSLNSSK